MNVAFPTIADAIVTQEFGNYNPQYYSGDGRHKGIDYGVPVNSSVYACADGEVVLVAIQSPGYGRHVRIMHLNGAMSIYAHLASAVVNSGEMVKAGQLIGRSGGDPRDNIDGDGTSTGPHLHWEVRAAGQTNSEKGAIDPILYCNQYLPPAKYQATATAQAGLNVRVQPVNGAVLYQLFAGEKVDIMEINDNWARLRALRPEWCSVDFLEFEGNNPTSEISDAEKLKRLWDAHPELH